MVHYLKYRIWDWALCVCISLGLAFSIYAGFILKDSLSSNIPAVAVILCAVFFVVFLFSYSKMTKIIGTAAGIILLAAFIIYAQQANPFSDETNNSYAIFWAVTLIVALLVYFATRTRPALAVLFLAGNFVIAGSYFLKFPVHVWSFLLFTFCIFVMYWYRNYSISLKRVHTGKVRMKKYMTQSLTICLAAFVLAGAVFFGVIKPLAPPTHDLKLITKLESMQMLKVLGVSTTLKVLNPDLTSNQKEENNTTGNQQQEQNKDSDSKETDQKQDNSDGSQNSDDKSGNKTNSSVKKNAQKVHYDLKQIFIPWRIILAVAIIIFIFSARLCLKKRWRRNVRALNREDGIVNYYLFFMSRLARTGHKKPASQNLTEYAKNMEHQMQVFAAGESTFLALTEIYIKVIYGNHKVTDREYKLFEQFYDAFHKNLRREIGTFRYFLKLFRI